MFVARSICASIVVVLGSILCLVPGIIVGLGISQYSYLVVDQGLGGVDALKKSWEMTNGHKMNLFLFGLLAFLVVIAGVHRLRYRRAAGLDADSDRRRRVHLLAHQG